MTSPRTIRSSLHFCVGLFPFLAAGCSSGDDSGNMRELSAAPAAVAATEVGVADTADTVIAEVAQTEAERAEGLMYRESLEENAGMLFIFPQSSVRSFWMENTYIPLDIAFMDVSFRIVDIQQMEPMTTDLHMSRAAAMYALEVNQGWFEAHGVRIGDVAEVVFGR